MLLQCAKTLDGHDVWINALGVMKKPWFVQVAEGQLAFAGPSGITRAMNMGEDGLLKVTKETGGIFGIHLPWTPVIDTPFFHGSPYADLPIYHIAPNKPVWMNWMEDDGSIFVPMLSWFQRGEHLETA